MSIWTSSFPIKELQLNEYNKIIAKFDKNLPHYDFICQKMCNSWNILHIEKYINGILKDKIISAVMTCEIDKNNIPRGRITVTFIDKFRLSQKYKNELINQLVNNFFNKWVKEFFSYNNIMIAPDGIKLIVI